MPEFNITRDIGFHLSHVSLNGYKSIEELECDIQSGMNILIGKNGAGKSNFFQFLAMINRSLFSVDGLTFKNAELIFSGSDGQHFKYGVSKLNHKKIDEEALQLDYRQYVEINNELIYDNADENLSFIQTSNNRKFTPRNMYMLFARLKVMYPGAIYIGFGLPEKLLGLSEPMSLDIVRDYDNVWEISDTNVNLLSDAFFKFEMALQKQFDMMHYEEGFRKKKYEEILENIDADSFLKYAELDAATLKNLKKFSPIHNIRINKNITVYFFDDKILIDNIKLEFLINESWLPWSQLSDGTKRLFLMISEISLRPDSVILVEEPELGIHPHQFDLVMQFLKEQSRFQQIIISTHSPKALDVLEPNELNRIMVASYKKGEGTKINHLNQVQVEKAIGYMHDVGYLSDYWLMSDLES